MKKNIVLILLVGISMIGCDSSLEFTELPIGGNIEVTDKSGQLVSFKSFQEPVLLVFFGYTYCPDFCPNTLAKIKAAVEPLSARCV